ncbi:M48 family metallopeptidase [Campylobacter sp. faydin G-105]|uniref:M48 family metallopeptidase n=1 Tax=Campylobacter anatolicus TaxID=2829105 RepID=UPI001B9A0DCE|nr:M48 family metallopeptidase [Campylobacter anatolicus]MBR8462675.1 M48 family metallopeptidase [Campylobacter anatolicus]
MFYALIFLYLLYTLVRIYLCILDINFVKNESYKPAVVLSEDEYKNAAIIKIDNHKFEIIGALFHAFVFIIWATWGLRALSEITLTQNAMSENIIFVMSFLLINAVIELPFSLYESFVKDKKQGFSNITPKIFIIDTIKSLALTLVFGSLFVWLILLCINFLGELWWMWAFMLSFVIILIINLIYPTLIAPIFNKVKPLEDSDLKRSIIGLLDSCGFKSSGVFILDASRRDNRLNAYFGGLGATKRVVLFDTLIEKLQSDEIIAVLGHELGHFKHKDIFKMIALSAVMLFCMFLVFGNISNSIYNALGLSDNGGAVIVFLLLFSPIFSFIFTPIISYFSRKNEFEADEFGASVKSRNDMVSALKKLGSENKAFPKAHPLYSFVYHSHPSLYERINELSREDI